MLAPGALDSLPDAENVIYMAGKKFGTDGNEYATWAMNTWLPSRVAERYQSSRIVVFSSGNLYPKVGVHSGGATEETRTEPVGEYCMSCQGRERMFEYAAKTYGTRVAVYRLNYAVDLRYGVLYDMAHNILEGKPISITTPVSYTHLVHRQLPYAVPGPPQRPATAPHPAAPAPAAVSYTHLDVYKRQS